MYCIINIYTYVHGQNVHNYKFADFCTFTLNF